MPTTAVLSLFGFVSLASSFAEVKTSLVNGFTIRLQQTVKVNQQVAYKAFVSDFGEWYDAEHSYSGKAENLSLDLQRHCMLERLPDGGFVRHMEIVFYQPGKMLRMTGGLGPLQGMGVTGALTYSFTSKNESDGTDHNSTVVSMTYAVSGADDSGLDQFAKPVHQVLASQLKRYERHCLSLAGERNDD